MSEYHKIFDDLDVEFDSMFIMKKIIFYFNVVCRNVLSRFNACVKLHRPLDLQIYDKSAFHKQLDVIQRCGTRHSSRILRMLCMFTLSSLNTCSIVFVFNCV